MFSYISIYEITSKNTYKQQCAQHKEGAAALVSMHAFFFLAWKDFYQGCFGDINHAMNLTPVGAVERNACLCLFTLLDNSHNDLCVPLSI